MDFKKRIALLLIISFVNQICMSPVLAMYDDIESLEHHKSDLIKHTGCLPSPLSFKAHSRTAAGVFPYMQDEEGEFYTIVGERIDGKGSSNVGGMSDEDDGFLEKTAIREMGEESLEILSTHPHLLSRTPFVDLYSSSEKEEGLLYRMYFWQSENVKSSQFNKALEEARIKNFDLHSREYKRFVKIKIKNIWRALEDKNKTVRFLEEETGQMLDIQLFEPFFNMLMTPSCLNFLDHLAHGRNIPKFSLYGNKLYFEEALKDSRMESQGQATAPRGINARWKWESVPQETPEEDPHPRIVELHQDAERHTHARRHLILEDGQVLASQDISYGAQKNEKIFAQSFSVKIQAQRELEDFFDVDLEGKLQRSRDALASVLYDTHALAIEERQAEVRTKEDQRRTNGHGEARPQSDFWDPNALYTMSEGLLLLGLGKEYEKKTDAGHQSASNPQRSADKANLKKYYDKYNSCEGVSGVPVAHTLVMTEHFIERLADVMAQERHYRDRIPFFHATEDEIGHFFKVISSIRGFITLRGHLEGTLSALRMTDIYFRDVKTMEDAIEMYGTREGDGNTDRMLFGNMALVAGRQTARVSSSSVQYWRNGFSASFSNIDKRFEQGSALLGMDFGYGPYRSLYHQFMADTGNLHANSSLLLLLFSPELLKDYAYASSGFGLFYEMPTGEENKTTHSAAFLYGRAQREINRVAELGGEDFTEEKKDFFAEVRVLIHPDIMRDPAKVSTFIFDLFPLSLEKQKKFQREMDNITRANMGDWLSQNTFLMPGSLQEDIRIKALYKTVYQMRHGQELAETFNSAGLLSMAKNGSLSSFKAFVEGYPNFVQEMGDPKKLFEAAVQSGNHDLQDYISNRFFNHHLETHFSPLEIRMLVKKCVLCDHSISSLLKCLFKGYDLGLFSSKTKEAWSREVLRLDHLESEFLRQIHEKLSPFTDQQVESTVIKLRPFKGSELERLAAFLNEDLLTSEKAMSLLLRRLKNASGDERHQYMEKIAFIFKNNLKYKEIDPDTGNPYVFCITDLDTSVSNESYRKILDVLEKDADLLQIKTRHGLNLLQHILYEYFNGEIEITFELNELVKKHLAQGQADFSSMEEFGFPEEFQTQPDFSSREEFGFPEELQTQPDFDSMGEFGFLEEFQTPYFYTEEGFNSLPWDNLFRIPNVQECRTRLKAVVGQGGDGKALAGILKECPNVDVFTVYKRLFRTRIEDHSMHKIEEIVRERERMEEDLEVQAIQKFDANPVQTLAEVAEGTLSAHLLRSKVHLIFRDENSTLPFIHKLFDHFYPNVKSNRYRSVLRDMFPPWSPLLFHLLTEKQNQILEVFLEWAGFQDFLSVLTQFEMTSFLWRAPSDLKKKAYREAPSVFEIVEDERDFFSLGLKYLEAEEVRALALSNKKKLKEMGKDGDSRLTELLESEEKTNLLIELIQEDPDLLEGFASEDGLTFSQNADCLEGTRWNWAALLLEARKKGMEKRLSNEN